MANSATHGISAADLTFTFSTQALRVVTVDGEPWFCAADVCDVLGYANSRKAIADHCRAGGVTKRDTIDNMGRAQPLTFINEGNLYRLCIKSHKPEAQKFEAWVCDEVLPAIRKTGRYVAPNAPELAKAEYLAGKDLQNIRRLIWFAARRFKQDGLWTQAVWFHLRRALGVPSPYPWAVSDLPRLATELQHVNAITAQIGTLMRDIEHEAVRRIFRKGEDADAVIKALKQDAFERLASESAERALMPSYLHGEVQSLLTREGIHRHTQYVANEQAVFTQGVAA